MHEGMAQQGGVAEDRDLGNIERGHNQLGNSTVGAADSPVGGVS